MFQDFSGRSNTFKYYNFNPQKPKVIGLKFSLRGIEQIFSIKITKF